MSLSDFLCGMFFKPLLDLGCPVRRRGKMPLGLDVLDCYETRSESSIVALEGLDKLSRSLSWGCTCCCSGGNHQWMSVVCRSKFKSVE